jgi:hypothetical protein
MGRRTEKACVGGEGGRHGLPLRSLTVLATLTEVGPSQTENCDGTGFQRT